MNRQRAYEMLKELADHVLTVEELDYCEITSLYEHVDIPTQYCFVTKPTKWISLTINLRFLNGAN